MLTARQLKIIKLIMNNPGIHGKEISENLNVSTRTIRSEITFMNDVTNCILIRSSTKQGYMINDEHLDIIRNIVNQDNENVDLAVYRIYKIIGKILFFEDCSIYDLSELLGLSDSVIHKGRCNQNHEWRTSLFIRNRLIHFCSMHLDMSSTKFKWIQPRR